MSKLISNRFLWLTALMALLIFNVEKTVLGVKLALKLCASTIIPSLFIFMVFSNVLVTALSKEKNIKLSPKIIICLLGSFCGFPIGASVCNAFCDNKIFSKKDAALLIPYCNNASFGFVVGAVGYSFFGSLKLGYILFISQLIASFVPIFLIKINYSRMSYPAEAFSMFEAFLKSIERSIKSILNICGLICVFSALLELLKSIHLNFLSIFLEISSGVAYCVDFKEACPCLSFVLCGFCCGFSGICVLLQIKSAFEYSELKFSNLLAHKIFQGILTALLSFAGYNFFVCT